ncbi:MAG: sensor domain-containing diguanylate cyclase, partial [Clostridia bacterium]
PSGIFLSKNDDILTIIYANDFFYKIYGYSSPKEAIDDNFTYANKTVVENLDESTEYRKAIIEKKSICFELETRENDRYGNEMWLLTRFEYLPQTDELAGAVINITERKHIKEQLSINEEEYRVLTRHTTNKIGRYDILRRQLLLPEDYAKRYALPTSICGLPQSIIKTGLIAVKSISTYESFFNDINSGKPDGSVVVQLNEIDGTTTWWNISFDTIFSDSGVPQRAVIIYDDITVLREKETAYEKWKQEILSMSKEKTAIFEWNLSQDVCEGESGEQLVHFENINRFDFNGRTNAYSQYIHRSERIAYKTILNRERLIAAFDEGVASYELEFREIIDDDSFKWMFLDVKLVPYPNSKDIKAYIIMRDIDSEKKERIDVQRRAREDALTGLLNRATFEDETKNLLNCAQNGIQIAFLMIDIDGFKKVNDTMGHTVGDEVLIDLAKKLKTIKHREYIVGRLGGDEFAICINNIPKSEDFKSHAQAICELLRKNIDKNLTVSASVGIAIFPDDGQNFDELYRKSDIALYEAKKCGRNRYKFYENSMENTAYIANATQIN